MIVLLFALASTALAMPKRAIYEDYLSSVYNTSDFSTLSDSSLYDLYDNLTFYYDGFPQSPSGRTRQESHLYAGTTCDCLHIQLDACVYKQKPYDMCEYWNQTTYMNMDWLKTRALPVPDNAWFEGLTYVGEWGWPISCWGNRWQRSVYGFNGHMWLYPTKGIGLWFNMGKTSFAYTKVGWLIKYGKGIYGANKTEIMDWAAEKTCPGYKTRTGSCEVCSNPLDTSKCCCHGSGRNLGCQVRDYKVYNRVSMNDALDAVADYYINGAFGEDGSRHRYPEGTYFGVVNILDDAIMRLQKKFGYVTAQFLREPQHRQVYKEFSDPVYSFEVLAEWNFYGWDRFCGLDGKLFGVIDPLPVYAEYMANGYLTNPGKVMKTTAWKPRPAFAALFGMTVDELVAQPQQKQQQMLAAAAGNVKNVEHLIERNSRHGRW